MPSALHNLYNELSAHRKKYAVAFVMMGALGSSLVEQRHELFCNNLTPDVTPAMTQAYNDCIMGTPNKLITTANAARSDELRRQITAANGMLVVSAMGLGGVAAYDLARALRRRGKKAQNGRDFGI